MVRVCWHRVRVALSVVVLVSLVVLALSCSAIRVATDVGDEGLSWSPGDFSAVPQPLVDEANKLGNELFGNQPEKSLYFAQQLLATYLEAKDKDFIIFFNSGGWGRSPLEADPGWPSIADGIESKLTTSGYRYLVLSYRRTADTFGGRLDELVEMFTNYPSKAKDLASRVGFLTTHLPGLKVILAGESNGAPICDRVMDMMKDNPQVYSIQTGPPFWHKSIMSARILVINNNGNIPDSFSRGDFGVIVRANLGALLGKPDEDAGRILYYVRAPGHDYQWQYPGVYSKITEFLDESFGTKQL